MSETRDLRVAVLVEQAVWTWELEITPMEEYLWSKKTLESNPVFGIVFH